MKKRYIVFIKLGYENINMAICNTKDIAIKCSQKINEYISSIDSISEKISNEELNNILDKYPEILESCSYNRFLQNNNKYSKLDIIKAMDFYNNSFKNYSGVYVEELRSFDSENQVDYVNIFI